MAEDASAGGPDETRRGSVLLLGAVVGLVGVAIGGGGVYVTLSRGLGPEPAAGRERVEEAAPAESAGFDERVHSLEPFVVNVSGEGYPRYVKLQLAFELDSPGARAELEERIVQVRDLTILLLSSKRLADIEGFEGKALLKDDLRERVNAILSRGTVESVLFTEFVIQ